MPASEASLASRSDLELLQLTAAGDDSAFAVFVERYQRAVFRHACCLAGRAEDAEDLLQDTFLAALKAAGQFRGDSEAKAWLFQITRRAAYRKVEPPKTALDDEETLASLALKAGWGSESPETLAMLAEDRARLDRAVADLPLEEREILLLREWEKVSGQEAAALLGLTIPAMKSRLHRSRIHLAALLRGDSAEKGGAQ